MTRRKRVQRKKVTFEWNREDLGRLVGSIVLPNGTNGKYYDFPNANYATSSYDRVMRGDKVVGLSMFTGYSDNEKVGLSLGVVDQDLQVGDELVLVWGEEGGGTRKVTVERHQPMNVRVRVAPTPYARDAREGYAQGWRTRQS